MVVLLVRCTASLMAVLLVLMAGDIAGAEVLAEPAPDEWLIRELAPPEVPLDWQHQLAVHGLFSDGMVLQREQPVPVWGWGPEGADIEVYFAGACVKTKVSGHCWSVSLPPMPACAQGRELRVVCGTRTIAFQDVLVGDVWLCSGQSNMQVEMKLDAQAHPLRAADIAAANNPLVRFYKVDRASSRSPRRDVPPVRNELFAPWFDAYLGNQWRPCTKDWVPHVSATAFYFARELQPAVKCPIGMLVCARGATGIGHWVPAELMKKEDCWNDQRKPLARAESDWAAFIHENAEPRRAYKQAYPTLKALWLAQQDRNQKTLPEPGNLLWPSCFYNGMLHPMVPFAIKGVLWYQGENDANPDPTVYTAKLTSLINCWRGLWQRPEMPFLIAQLPGFSPPSGDGGDPARPSAWAGMREAQARVARQVPYAYLAVLIDAGMHNNIHPYRKDIVGVRLAQVARKEVYHEAVAAYGPVFQSVAKQGGTLVLTFAHGEEGLLAKEVDLDGNHLPAGILKGFMICGSDRRFVQADAKIDGNRVIVSSPQVTDPVAVRYAWADFPLANLYNENGLPATPFQAEADRSH